MRRKCEVRAQKLLGRLLGPLDSSPCLTKWPDQHQLMPFHSLQNTVHSHLLPRVQLLPHKLAAAELPGILVSTALLCFELQSSHLPLAVRSLRKCGGVGSGRRELQDSAPSIYDPAPCTSYTDLPVPHLLLILLGPLPLPLLPLPAAQQSHSVR